MQIQLSKISSMDGASQTMAVPFEMEEITLQSGSFPVVSKEEVVVNITNIGRHVLDIEGKTALTVAIPCDRCLKDVHRRLDLSFQLRLDMKLTDEDRIECLDESSYLTGMELDVDRLVFQEAVLNWPQKILCRQDCKGLCPSCGKDLNNGPCGCQEGPKDLRMAAFSDLKGLFGK